MKTITHTLLKFDELNDEQKAKAIELNHDTNTDGLAWWDGVESDFREVARLMGIRIDKMYFSGFWNQGDGACFTGEMRYAPGIVAAVEGYAPQDTTLHTLAARLRELHRLAFYGALVCVEHSGRYSHEWSMSLDIEHERGKANYDAWRDWCADFARWIYKRLEREHEFQTSDEQVAESLRANEVEFEIDEDGDIV
jgi:hypothetical protein